jgi:hypothetical protein
VRKKRKNLHTVGKREIVSCREDLPFGATGVGRDYYEVRYIEIITNIKNGRRLGVELEAQGRGSRLEGEE